MFSNWQPTASLNNLQLRAEILKNIRHFFQQRNVLEVETPLICNTSATDPYLASFETHLSHDADTSTKLYLQTSPEFAMKRLLAAGYGSIFQICKAFRNGESGKRHNPEFTILEWYRMNFSYWQLMDEMDELLQLILKTTIAQRSSYHDLFQQYFSINPHTCSIKILQKIVEKFGLFLATNCNVAERDSWLNLLLTHIIEPELGKDNPIFVYDYPASQAALAKIRHDNEYDIGERFEAYYKGIELANGYHELADVDEHLKRFEQDNQLREELNFPIMPVDQNFLSALPTFPNCAGVALGVDRLILLAAQAEDISEVISFPISRA